MRLDGYLSLSGYTRKQAKALITAGRVSVDAVIIRDPKTHISAAGCVLLDGHPLAAPGALHLMLYKPDGVITATEDSRDTTVLDLIPPQLRRRDLGPVGRLDKDVTGLVLLTTDGQLAHRLISPKWSVEKRYIATVEGILDESHVRRMAEGIPLKDFTCKPAALTILSSGEQSTAEIVVTEGKYHQVKRMFGALERPVVRLHRASIGGITLDASLARGEYRELAQAEIEALYALVELEPKSK